MRKVTIHWKRASEILDLLMKAYHAKAYPYDFAKEPQRPENLPKGLKWGSRQHACLLFCFCYYMRGKIDSETAIIYLARIWEKYPEIFDPAEFALPLLSEEKEKKVFDILCGNGLNFNAKQTAEHWVKNFHKIHRFWDSNPVNLFRSAATYQELCARLISSKKRASDPNGFFGFREKMVSMLGHFYADAGIVGRLRFKMPSPIDFHLLRIFMMHDAFSVEGLSPDDNHCIPEVLDALREITVDYAKKAGEKSIDISAALWLLSSTLCFQNPGNRSVIGEYKARGTEVTMWKPCWSETEMSRYRRSCGRCPLSATCSWNVASGYYYLLGKAFRVPKRRPPGLFFAEDLFGPKHITA